MQFSRTSNQAVPMEFADMATAICFSLAINHPFVDGTKPTGHAATELFLVMNGTGAAH